MTRHMEPSNWRLMTTDKNRQTRRNLNTMARLHYTVARSAVKVKFHAVKATSTLTLSNKTYHIENTQPVHSYISLRLEMSTTDRVCGCACYKVCQAVHIIWQQPRSSQLHHLASRARAGPPSLQHWPHEADTHPAAAHRGTPPGH